MTTFLNFNVINNKNGKILQLPVLCNQSMYQFVASAPSAPVAARIRISITTIIKKQK